MLIKPDKTADFEAVLAKYKEALGKSDNPKRKEQLAGMKFFKSPTADGRQHRVCHFRSTRSSRARSTTSPA